MHSICLKKINFCMSYKNVFIFTLCATQYIRSKNYVVLLFFLMPLVLIASDSFLDICSFYVRLIIKFEPFLLVFSSEAVEKFS